MVEAINERIERLCDEVGELLSADEGLRGNFSAIIQPGGGLTLSRTKSLPTIGTILNVPGQRATIDQFDDCYSRLRIASLAMRNGHSMLCSEDLMLIQEIIDQAVDGMQPIREALNAAHGAHRHNGFSVSGEADDARSRS